MNDRKPQRIPKDEKPREDEKTFVLREDEAVNLRRKLIQMVDELDKFMGKNSGRKMLDVVE